LFASYLGLFGVAGLFAAAGVFASVLAKNQISAFITGFFICFAFFMTGKMSVLLPPEAARLTDFIGIDCHISQFARGIVDSRSLFYFLGAGGLFLFFANLKLMAARTR
ncbi:MAG: hypothetical protein PHW69_09995, partial [Elusimicrobiaceae bacterium]|nr:hypothetical protein [Elusimicrobiaceae bacterium]